MNNPRETNQTDKRARESKVDKSVMECKESNGSNPREVNQYLNQREIN